MSAPLPLNEAQRLQTLRSYHILDTPPEAAFDRLTNLAAKLFDVPIALVSLVDANRQWFKSCYGMENHETERKWSFCAYTILSSDVMAVPDATIDPRFIDNISVTGTPHVRSYMGAPLRTPNGQNLGSLCIIDTQPHQFSRQQQALLADMAGMVVDELELRRVGRELRESVRQNNQLAVAITNLTSGITITDPNLPGNPIIFANEGFYAMTGYGPHEVIGHSYHLLEGSGTDMVMANALQKAVARQQTFTGVLLHYRKDGPPFLNELIVNPVYDTASQLLSYVTVQNDVTQREQAKQLLEQKVNERTQELAHSQVEILERLARAAEFRDDTTGEHTQRVARMAGLLARALDLPNEQVVLIEQAAPLHDVGKIAISDLVLLSPHQLSPEEYAIMQTHAAIGAALLSNGRSKAVQMAERIAGSHHEHWDGTGYPRQLQGEEIPLEGRILAVVDVFDALTHERPYKKAWAVEEAVAEIRRQSGTQFDPRVVDAFLTLPHEKLI